MLRHFRLVTQSFRLLVIVSVLLTSVPAPIGAAAYTTRPASAEPTGQVAVEPLATASRVRQTSSVPQSPEAESIQPSAHPATFQSPLPTPEPPDPVEPGVRLYAITDPPAVELGAGMECTVTLVVVNEDLEDLDGLVLSASLPPGLRDRDDPEGRDWSAPIAPLAIGATTRLTLPLRVNSRPVGPVEFAVELRDADDTLRTSTTAMVGVTVPEAAQEVAPVGGQFTSDDGRVRAVFPPGALRTAARVSARIHEQRMVFNRQRSPWSWDGTLLHFSIEARDAETRSEVGDFGQPVTLTLDLRGLVGEEGLPLGWDPFLYYLADAESGELEEVPAAFDPQTCLLVTQLDHFSEYYAGASGEGWKPLLTPPVPDLFSGAATYSYPIEVPPGRNGLQPQISLGYNSRGIDGLIEASTVTNGPIGLGWSVGGVAGIVRDTRVSGNGILKIHDSYSLALNGTSYRLEPETPGQSCGRYYVRDGPSLYVERRNAACQNGSSDTYTTDYWIVRQPDGTELRLGAVENSQTWMRQSGMDDNGFCSPDDPQHPLVKCATRWQVDTVTDTMDNRMAFTYQTKYHSGGIEYSNIRVERIQYNNYAEQWLSEVRFKNVDADEPMRIDKIEVWNVGTRVRYYELTQHRASRSAHGHTTSDRVLLKIQEFSGNGAKSLPATQFEQVLLQNGPYNGFRYRRLKAVDNGYGGRTEFSYESDGRWVGPDYHLPEYGYCYRVNQVHTYDGIHDPTPARVAQYSYGQHCYNQTNSHTLGDGVRCRDRLAPEDGPLVGHAWVQETALDFDGTSPLAKTTHRYYIRDWGYDDDYWRQGRAYQTQGYSGQDELLSQTDTTWNNQDNGTTTFAHVIRVLTTDHTVDPTISTRVDYEYDTYGNTIAEYHRGNPALSGDERSLHRVFYPNTATSVWIVNKVARETVYAGIVTTDNPNTTAAKAQTRYYYDQTGSYTTPPTQGMLRRVDQGTGHRNQYAIWDEWVTTYSTYDSWGNLVSETDPNGHTTEIVYDSAYDLYPVDTWNDLDQHTITQYYGIGGVPADHGLPGQVKRVIDPNGAATDYRYDALGRLRTVIRSGDSAQHPTEEYQYYDGVDFLPTDSWPLLVNHLVRGESDVDWWSDPDGLGGFEQLFYDGLGQLVQTQHPADDWSLSGGGHRIVNYTVYDALGRAAQQSVPYEEDQYVYQEVSAKVVNPYLDPDLGQPHTTTQYDDAGRVYQVENPDGSSTYQRYFSYVGLMWHDFYDENQHRRAVGYDGLGRMVRVDEFTGNCWPNMPAPYQDLSCGGTHTDPWDLYATTLYECDALDNLTSVTDAADGPSGGNVTTMGYDALSRKKTMDDPDMGFWDYAYDDAGNLIVQDDAQHQRVCFYYDELNRLEHKYYTNDTTSCPSSPAYDVTYTYDSTTSGNEGVGRRTGMSDGSGSTSWIYDLRGRVTEETRVIDGAGTFVTEYTYDAMDRVVEMTYPDGEVVANDHGFQGPESLTGDTAYVENLDYDASGRTTLIEFGGAGLNLETNYVYYPWTTANGLGRLRDLQTGTSSNPTSLQDLTYTYDPVGNVTQIVDGQAPNGTQTSSFQYDDLDRLTYAHANGTAGQGGYTREYDYDEIGNLTDKDETDYYYQDSAHKHAATHLDGTTPSYQKYWYDANGNMITRKENGNTYTQVFNAENELESVTVDGETTEFVYDGDGNRVLRTEPDGTLTAYVGGYFEKEFGAQVNVVPNPGFENSSDWSGIASSTYPGTSLWRSHWGTAAPHGGSYGYAISNHAYGILVSSAIAVSPNTQYDLHAYVRGEIDAEDSGGGWIIRANFYDSGGAYISYQNAASGGVGTINTTWQHKGGTVTTLSNAASVRIQLYNYLNSGWVAYDDVSFKAVGSGTNLVPNPGFESSGSWTEHRGASFPGTSLWRSHWGTAAPHGGSYAYAISNHAYGYLQSTDIPVRPNHEYDLYTYLRGELDPEDSGGGWIIRACFYDSGGAYIGYQDAASGGAGSLNTTWREEGGTVTAPSNAASVRIQLYNYLNSGWVAYDDVRLLDVTEAETKYYHAAGQRVAMNKDGVVYYLHADHLGSTSLATNESGQEVTGSRTLYYPYGEQRWSASGGTLPTDYTFTGQRNEAGTGLMDYNARFYDAALGRFVSADTIVHSPGDPQSLNRYSYVAGNPLKYTDPTGHMVKPPRRHPISIDISAWNPRVVQALDVVQEATRTVAELPPIVVGPVAAARSFVKYVEVDSEAGTMVVGNRDPVSANELALQIAGMSAVIGASASGIDDAVGQRPPTTGELPSGGEWVDIDTIEPIHAPDSLIVSDSGEILGRADYYATRIDAEGFDLEHAIPVVRTPGGRIIQTEGHHRLEALRRLGYRQAPIQPDTTQPLGAWRVFEWLADQYKKSIE